MQPFEKLHGRERIEREVVEAQEERRDLGSLQLCVLLLPLGSLYTLQGIQYNVTS
jgi:hypothetical protein